MSEDESHLGQQDPFLGIRSRLKNLLNPPKPQSEDPKAISRREFLKKVTLVTTGTLACASIVGKIVEAQINQADDRFVPSFDRFEEVVPNLEVRNFSSVKVALSKTEINEFIAKYGQLPGKISILFYEGKVPDQLSQGEVLKFNLSEALMPGNAGRLDNFQRKTSAEVASALFELAKNGRFQENPIAEKDFEQKIQKGLLPPLIHLSN